MVLWTTKYRMTQIKGIVMKIFNIPEDKSIGLVLYESCVHESLVCDSMFVPLYLSLRFLL